MIIKLKLISSYFSINAPQKEKTKNAEELLVSGIWMNLSKIFTRKNPFGIQKVIASTYNFLYLKHSKIETRGFETCQIWVNKSVKL